MITNPEAAEENLCTPTDHELWLQGWPNVIKNNCEAIPSGNQCISKTTVFWPFPAHPLFCFPGSTNHLPLVLAVRWTHEMILFSISLAKNIKSIHHYLPPRSCCRWTEWTNINKVALVSRILAYSSHSSAARLNFWPLHPELLWSKILLLLSR